MVAVVGSPFLMFPVNNANASQVNRNLPVAVMNLFTLLGYYCIKRIIFFISCSVAQGLVMMMAEESRNTGMDIIMLPAVPNLLRQCTISRLEIVRMPRLLRT